MNENKETGAVDAPFTSNNNNTVQDQNWRLMTILQMSWAEAAALEGEDREFLLEKAVEVEGYLQQQQKQQQDMMQQQMQQPQMQMQQPQMQMQEPQVQNV